MIGIIFVLGAALFINDNAEFIQDMNDKRECSCTFSYTGNSMHGGRATHCCGFDTYIYFTMEPCDE